MRWSSGPVIRGTNPRALLIVNRNSRSGNADLAAGIELLKSQGLDVLQAFPDSPDDIPALIRRHREAIDRVIVGGGDGTLNCAAEALVETGLPLGILPMGTANDLARTLHIPADLVEACAVIATCPTRAIDLGCVNGKLFFNAASIGMGVEVNRQLSRDVKARWGALGYARSLVDTVRQYRPFRARIACDGRTVTVLSIQIGVANGRHYGGGMTAHEDAAVDDHRLDLYSVKPRSLWHLIRVGIALRRGRYDGERGVRHLYGRRIEVRTRKPLPVTADGEMVAHTPASFSVMQGAVSVYVPESYARQKELADAAKRSADRPQ